MSKIQKMSICGIRSFDHRSTMSIEFKAPLTLIVGVNGSGKTTIIECLKFVTCGELPPNSDRGQSFVHDPKMVGEKEVLAQVKLMFESMEEVRMVCTRNMSLTVKKDTRTFKQLEGAIRMAKGGERNAISSRVGELDAMMPRYLGVSKAVLENVIFCHQEDSLWPMQVPSALKKKFDEIFEAYKYTKAIENIRVLQKNKRIELTNLKLSEDHAKADNEKGKKLKKQMVELEEQCDKLRDESEEFRRKIDEATERFEQTSREHGKVFTVVSELKGKRIELQSKRESIEGLRENLKEMSETDEELQRIVEQYDQQVNDYEEQLENHKTQYRQMEEEVKAARSLQSAKERDCGSYEAQKATNDRQIQNRNRLIHETARSHDLRGYDINLDEDQAKRFMQEITRKARDQQAEFERVRAEVQEDVQNQQTVLNRISEDISALKQRKDSSRQQISTYDRKISSIQSQKSNLPADNEAKKVTIEARLEDSTTRLQAAKSDLDSSRFDEQAEVAEREIRRLEDVREKLDAEQTEAARRSGDSAQLDYVQKESNARKRSLETMIKAHNDKITSIVGNGWTPKTLEATFQRVISDSEAQVKEAGAQRDGTSRELDAVTAKLQERSASVKKAQAEVKAATAAISDAAECAPKELQTTIYELEAERDDLKNDNDSFAKLQEYLEVCIKDVKNRNACKVCCRSFDASTNEAQKALDNIKKQQEKWRASKDAKDLLAECETALERAKKAVTHFDAWERLIKKEIPSLKEEEAKLDNDRQRLLAKLEQEDSVFKEKEASRRDNASYTETISTINQYNKDIENFQQQIVELTESQKAAGLSRGLEAVQADIKKIDSESKAHRATHTEAVRQRDNRKSAISALELEVSSLGGKLKEVEYSLREKKALDDQEQEYNSYKADEKAKIKKIDSELEDKASDRATEQARYDDKSRRGADRDRQQQERANKLNNSVNKLNAVVSEIKSYEDQGGDEQLDRARHEKGEAESAVAAAILEQQEVIRKIKQLEEQLSSHTNHKRNVTDNQRYRRDLRQFHAVEAEVEQLEGRNAEAEADRLSRETNKWHMKKNELAAAQATVIGQLKGVDNQLKTAIEYYSTEYKGANKKYKEAHIMVETTKGAIEDLGRYGGALDKAIMTYHTLKMAEINKNINDLWQSTYQGTDVDTVLIRSEAETVKANKSYNYRVVMVKQDTEMDMRGRCSAGQKVLASIIIRIALADTFGIHCGMLALDEPTTNLDEANIHALAKSLGRLIDVRKNQPNFQLIVITHDETFLSSMGCGDYADHYWRVSRDENQNTLIEKQSISQVI